MRKRLTAALLCLCLLFTLLPATAFAEGEADSGTPPVQSALCEHHPQHDESCGYTEGTEGSPCSHEHTEDCYKLVTECVHEHTAECYPAESVSENTATPSEPEEAEPTECTHECSEESGCITKTLDCKHEHDEACGYVPATEGTPCTFVCEVCNAQDSGDPATPSDAQPEECTCEKLCTEDNINEDCPVCGAEGADLNDCKGAAPAECTCEKLCTEGEINEDCPVCSAEGAELDKVCVGAAPMLPATAPAVTPRIAYDILWIGNTRITDSGYWTTDGNGNLTASDAGNYNVAFDADTSTLTLNNANIAGQYDSTYNDSNAGIYAYSSSGAVSLNIQVTGNNVVSGSIGIHALSNGGEVSVTISGGGSLTASGSQNGIWIQSNVSNAALAIEDTAVKASGTYNCGVNVQAGKSSSGFLSVNGGSLTASGRKGILFPIGTPSLNVNDSTIVRASGGIAAGSDEDVTVPTEGTGIVFNGSTGTVYGNASLQDDLIIGEGESLILDNGANLNANGHNVIVDGGTLDESLAESLGGSVIYKVTKVELDKTSLTLDVGGTGTLTATITPDNATNQNVTWSSTPNDIVTITPDTSDSKKATITATGTGTTTIKATVDGKSAECSVTVNAAATTITTQPGNVTVTEGETATFSVAATGSGTLTYQWQQNTDGSTWTDIHDATSSSYTTPAVTMDMDGWQYRCVVTGDGGTAESNAATLTVQKSTTPIDPKYVRYIVEHYQQNADGSYTLADTEQPIDEIGKTVTATPKTYDGYTYNPNAAGTVASGTLKAISSPDDIVTLKLYYDITLYTVTVNGSYAQTTGAGSYAEGATVAIDAGTRSDYTFDSWTSSDGVTFADADSAQTTFTMPDQAVTVTANWVKNSTDVGEQKFVRYIVEHYKQNADGSYTLADTERPIGEVGETVTAVPKNYDGYTYNPNAAGTVTSGKLTEIKNDADIVTLKLYYDITLYTVTVNGSYAQATGAGSYAEGAAVTIDAGTRSGYTFDGWTSSDGVTFANAGSAQTTFTMPDKAVTVTANWTKKSTGGGGGGGSSYDYYTISATAGEGGSISPSGNISVREGRDKAFTITPHSGYVISDVRVDGVSVGAVASYTFDNVRRSHTIEATFAKGNPATGNPFTDVHPDDWFYDHVMFVYGNGLMNGTSATTFSPNEAATRAQVAVIFYRMAGSPAVTGDSPFTDVENGPGTAWYYNAVLWAHQNGIVAGYEDRTYHPGDPVTREQLAVMFYNYANYKGYDLSATSDLSGFTDAGKISDWALPAMRWAVGSGLMNGYGDGTLNPQGTATRAQLAAMLHNFIEHNKLVPPAVAPGGESGTGGTGGTGTGSGGGGWTQQKPVPQTGDNSNIGLWISLCVLSFAGLVGTTIAYAHTKRKREEEEEAPNPLAI